MPAGDVVPLPDELTFEQGAAIPVNYATAWAGLIGYGNLQPGERVLIHSAGGGVGIAATQIAKRYGAEVYGTASPGKHARISELGVDHPLDYTKSRWEEGLPKFDIIMDAIAGRAFAAPTICCALAGGWWLSALPRWSRARSATRSPRSARCCGCRAST